MYGFSRGNAVPWWQKPRIGVSDALALGCGLVLALAHLPFLGVFIALPLAAMLLLVARQETARQAARSAFFVGLGFWALHLFWLPQSLSSIFGIVWLWPLIALVWVIEAAMWAGAAWLAHRLTRRTWATLVLLACLLVLLEWLRTWFPAPFPWGNFGYALVGTPVAQVASIGGVYLLSLMVALLAAALAALAWREWWPIGLVTTMWLLAFVFGLSRAAPTAPNREALLVQANIDPLGRALGQTNSAEAFRDLSKNAKPGTLVVWPEASLSLEEAKRMKLPYFVGGLYDSDYSQGAFRRINMVAAMRNGQELARTVKQREVPFGEYLPWQNVLGFIYRPIYNALRIALPETKPQAPRVLKLRENFGAFVCYDSIFPDVIRRYVQLGATVLLEATNDGWFGGGMGNAQHFHMDRLRAIETDRYLLRAANTGITALIDPRGAVLAQIPQNKALTLGVKYAAQTSITPYVRYGDWALGLAVLLAALALWLGRKPAPLI